MFLRALIFFLFIFKSQASQSQIRLPSIIRDSMVLQREMPISIWGWASPGEKIKLRFKNKNYSARANSSGNWNIQIPPQAHGGPFSMEIKGINSINLNEILIGDVWFCAGQSNMVHQLKLHADRFRNDIKQANNPKIRQFVVPVHASLNGEVDNTKLSYWKSAVKTDIEEFSVVAYFFAQSIFEKHGIPIGIINSSVGGTPIEAWTSEKGLSSFPNYSNTIARNKDSSYVNTTNRSADRIAATQSNGQHDLGMRETIKWYDTSLNIGNWQTIGVPGYWEDQGHSQLNGVAWFRKIIELPSDISQIDAKLHLGRIVDADEVYVNGKLIGRTSYQYPQRRYAISKGILQPGKNTIAVRVTNYNGNGGFVPGKPCVLVAGNYEFNLKGDWSFKVGEVFPRHEGEMVNRINFSNQPSALYNAMVFPFINYKVKGFAWYQGESNADRPSDYLQLMHALVDDWRNNWKIEKAPFVYVQLPNFMDLSYSPTESNWALLREAQLKGQSIPNTAMAVAIDLGEWNDIHPGNKKDVGIRLALAARKIAYGETNLISSGPTYKSHRSTDGKIIIQFENIGSGLELRNENVISGFEIAGENGKFYWAKASLVNDEIILSNENVPSPLHVRYAWADNPFISLYNKEGLPASPFRTQY